MAIGMIGLATEHSWGEIGHRGGASRCRGFTVCGSPSCWFFIPDVCGSAGCGRGVGIGGLATFEPSGHGSDSASRIWAFLHLTTGSPGDFEYEHTKQPRRHIHFSGNLDHRKPHGLWSDAACRAACFWAPKDREAAVAVLREAVENGVNHIDTSDFYGPHVTNQIIKEALHPYKKDLTIVTKVGARRGNDASWIMDSPPRGCGKRSRTTCAISASMF